MTRHAPCNFASPLRLCALLILLAAASRALAEPAPAAISAFNTCIRSVESRLAQQHASPSAFLAASSTQDQARLRQGQFIVEQLTPSSNSQLPGALLHHWRATAFVPAAKAADLERLLKDFKQYPRVFSPQVLQATVQTQPSGRLQATMRVLQQHILTVVMDSTYDIVFGSLDPRHRYSQSQSTRIAEIASPGTPAEHALSPQQEHGFLWRQNTYWTYEERDGGLYMQIESVSLTRSIPRGLGWAVQPFVQSVPRESLEFTLRSACNALRS